MTESDFKIFALETYTEMEKEDSIYVVLRNKKRNTLYNSKIVEITNKLKIV